MQYFRAIIVLSALSADSSLSAESTRTAVSAGSENVGMFRVDGDFRCTVTLIRHGLVLTAKHCFSHIDLFPSNRSKHSYAIVFPRGLANGPLYVRNPSIREIIFDEGDNDIAYMTFDPKVSVCGVAPRFSEIAANVNFDGKSKQQLETVGFTAADDSGTSISMVRSTDCETTGKKGRLGPSASEPEYAGVLIDTTCQGWYGTSGSPVFQVQKERSELIGVLTHTFALNSDGSVDMSRVSTDSFGSHTTINFSSLALAANFDKLLKEFPGFDSNSRINLCKDK